MPLAGGHAGRRARPAGSRSGPPRAWVCANAHRFIVGESLRDAAPNDAAAVGSRIASSVRSAGRGHRNPRSRSVCRAVLGDAPRAERRHGGAGRSETCLERDSSGPLPRANVSVKVSALTPLCCGLTPPSWAARTQGAACDRCSGRPGSWGARAHRHGVARLPGSGPGLVLEMLSTRNSHTAVAGLRHPGYLRDSGELLDTVLDIARGGGRRSPLQIPVVKGPTGITTGGSPAARLEAPVFESKADSDRNFRGADPPVCRRPPRWSGCCGPCGPRPPTPPVRSVAHADRPTPAMGGR